MLGLNRLVILINPRNKSKKIQVVLNFELLVTVQLTGCKYNVQSMGTNLRYQNRGFDPDTPQNYILTKKPKELTQNPLLMLPVIYVSATYHNKK